MSRQTSSGPVKPSIFVLADQLDQRIDRASDRLMYATAWGIDEIRRTRWASSFAQDLGEVLRELGPFLKFDQNACFESPGANGFVAVEVIAKSVNDFVREILSSVVAGKLVAGQKVAGQLSARFDEMRRLFREELSRVPWTTPPVSTILQGALQDGSKNKQERLGSRPRVRRDRKTEARDKWIYRQCCKRALTYDGISRLLKAEHPEWEHIESATGILKRAKLYAERHGLEPPPRRLEQS